jgi:hypothetical protein
MNPRDYRPTYRQLKLKIIRCGSLGIAIFATLSLLSLKCGAEGNSLVTLKVTVTTGARWVANPSIASIPPYFAANLSTTEVQVAGDASHLQLAAKVRDALTMRLRAMQSQNLAELEATHLTKRPSEDWIIIPKPSTPQQFQTVSGSLLQRLVSYDDTTVAFMNRPDPGPIAPSERITLNATLRVYEVNNITIVVKTTGNGNEQSFSFPLSDLWSSLPPDAPERRISVEVHTYSSNCCQLSPKEVAERTARSVLPLYKSLYALGLTIGSFDIANRLPIYTHALEEWNQNRSSELPQPVVANWLARTGQLTVDNLAVVYNIAISPSDGFEALRKRIQRRSCGELVGLPLTAQGEKMYTYLVEQDPAVKSVLPNYADGTFQLAITPQPMLASLKITGGASYDNQYGATGKLSALGQDLIPRGQRYDIGNTLQASYNGGGTSQTATLSESLIKASRDPMPKIDFYSFAVAGNFLQNQDVRFGAIVPGQTVTVNETQATAALKLSYDSFSIFDIADARNQAPPTRSRNRSQIVCPLGFMYEKYTAKGNSGTYRSVGEILQLSTSPDYLYTHDFDDPTAAKRKGWSEVDIDLKAEYLKGFGGNGYIGFDRYLGSATVTGYLGLKRTRQFQLQGQYGVGSLSSGGPIVRVFQLGGTLYVPGLQFGEVAGQTLGFMQGEAGMDFTSVFELFKHAAPSNIKLFDFRQSYVEMLYSRASVSQGESVSAVAGLGNAVQSFGPAITLGKLNNQFDLTAGYMYSPESTIHPHGTLYVGVTIYDFRMR